MIRCFTVSLTAVVLFAVIPANAMLSPSPAPRIATKMYQTTRARLAIARVRGQRFFGALIASAPGSNQQVADAILAFGGRIDYRADDVSYLRVRIPLNAVEAIAERDDVSTLDADTMITVLMPPKATSLEPPRYTPLPQAVPSPQATHKPRTAADYEPIVHPYRPEGDMGITALRKEHPLFDGRGVTVALLDPGPDFLAPELQHAKTLDGRVVPKFADILVGSPPNASGQLSPWLSVTSNEHAANGSFTYKAVKYRAPHDGDFRFILAPNQGAYGQIAARIDPKKKISEKSSAFGILWDSSVNTVWVDTNRNNDFSDEQGLTDYAVHHGLGIFHVAPTSDATRNTVGFAVQTAPREKKLNLIIGMQLHGTMTASSIAANKDDGGRVVGIAPEAQLVSIDEGSTDSSVIESAILAERDPRIDLLCFEIISAESYSLKDGRFIESVIFDRLIRKYGKPILQPADNDFGMSHVEEACNVPTVTCVGAYESRDSLLKNSGISVPHHDNFHWVSSYGPSGNGALKPSFLAPSGWVTAAPGSELMGTYAKVKGLFDLPPGYMIGGGTSQATPCAAGAFAVLIGAARASGVQVSNERLLDAASRTARFITGFAAYQQGNGLIQLDAAYDWLRRWSGRQLPQISFQAPIRTIDSPLLARPNRGVGFFEREGWSAGQEGTRELLLARNTQSGGTNAVGLKLIGNDGTFSMESSVALPAGTQVPVRFTVAPRTAGAHSALLRAFSGNEIIGETLMTVVAGEKFSAASGYVLSRSMIVPQPGTSSFFVTVPAHTQALVLRVNAPRTFVFNIFEGDGGSPLNRSNNLLADVPVNRGLTQAVFRYPRAGTWELELVYPERAATDPKGIIRSRPTSATITAYAVGIGARHVGFGGMLLTQSAAKLAGLGTEQTLAYAASHDGTIARGGQRVYNLSVPKGATGIAAALAASGANSPDLYLFDCTGEACLLREKSTSWESVHRLYYNSPAPGRWKLVVDGYGVGGDAAYRLRTLVLDPLANRTAAVIPVVTASLPGNDPSIYYNECPPGKCGELPERKGLNPVVFDVLIP